jgi:hypothetical protein
MGVNKRYVLQTSEKVLFGPAAYYYLLAKWNAVRKKCIVEPPVGDFSKVSWRKAIKPVFDAIVKYWGDRPGRLYVVKARNPMNEPHYRDFVRNYMPKRPKL